MSLSNSKSVEQKLLVKGPVGDIETVIRTSDVANSVAVCCHPHPLHGGTLTNKVVHTLHRTFHERGAHTVRFNFRGVGKSEGSFADGEGEIEDLAAVLEWVKHAWPELPIILSGFSFGAFVSLKMVGKFPLATLVSVAPPVEHLYFTDIIIPQFPWVVIQPMADEVVDPKAVVRWFHKNKTPQSALIEIEAGSHFLHGKLVEMKQKLHQALDGLNSDLHNQPKQKNQVIRKNKDTTEPEE